MQTYFNIDYEFDQYMVHEAIDRQLAANAPGYICVADGVILDIANRNPQYLDVINSSMFSICDSSYVPIYIRLIHGQKYNQYCGAEIFRNIVSSCKYRMIFLGAQKAVLDALCENISQWNPDVRNMTFVELPFCTVDEFDYPSIAETVNADGADIVWVSLGAPKQELFMYRLRPYLKHGVMIAVGAAFKFYSGLEEKRAPKWMVKHHLEFVHRIWQEPKKQLKRCRGIISSLPRLLISEMHKK